MKTLLNAIEEKKQVAYLEKGRHIGLTGNELEKSSENQIILIGEPVIMESLAAVIETEYPIAVIGPGTGLGVSILVPQQDGCGSGTKNASIGTRACGDKARGSEIGVTGSRNGSVYSVCQQWSEGRAGF